MQALYFIVNQDNIIILHVLLAVYWDLETQLIPTCLCIFPIITHTDYCILKWYWKSQYFIHWTTLSQYHMADLILTVK